MYIDRLGFMASIVGHVLGLDDSATVFNVSSVRLVEKIIHSDVTIDL